MGESKVVYFRDLKPFWGLKGAKEPGFFRWLVHYVSGEEPVFHANPKVGAISDHCKVGLWVLPVGQSQNKHYHPNADEIYVVTRGQICVESEDGSEKILGPHDCLYNAEGTVHGVRNCGLEDAVMVFVIAPQEGAGESVYIEED